MQSAPWPAWFIAAMAVIGLAMIYLTSRWAKAKTRRDYITCIALYIGIGIAAMVLIPLSGTTPTADQVERHMLRSPISIVPTSVILAFAVWFIGGNIIVMRQLRKNGRPWWDAVNPFSGFMQYMDAKSWLAILVLALISLAIGLQGADGGRTTASQPPTQKSP